MKGESGINKNLTKKFGANVQRIREAMGLTREELSEKAETSPQNLARIESGQRFVSSAQLINLARALNVEVADLFVEDKLDSKSKSLYLSKIERLLKSRNDEDIEFAHSVLTLIFKRLPKN